MTKRDFDDIPLPGMRLDALGYKGQSVCKIIDISYRQLDHWTTKGVVHASLQRAEGSGSQRLYSFQDIVRIQLVAELRKLGLPLDRIRIGLNLLDNLELENATVVGTADGHIYAIEGEDKVWDLLNSGQGVFLLAVAPVIFKTESSVATIHDPVDMLALDQARIDATFSRERLAMRVKAAAARAQLEDYEPDQQVV